MTLAELETLLTYLGAFGVGGVLFGIVVFYLLKSFVPSYLNEKAKNLATREDIAQITDEIESVKTQYAFLIEELKAKHQLRLAAIERRLQAHQEAFALWRELIANTHTENIGATVIKCQTWWENNCLFLEPAVREGFSDAYSAAHMHNALVRGGLPALHQAQENWQRITKAGQLIVEAVQLPGLTTIEKQELAELEPSAPPK
jgi:hypothetical protein